MASAHRGTSGSYKMPASNSTQPVVRLKRRILLRRPGVVRESSASLEDDSRKCKEGTPAALHSSATTNKTTVIYAKNNQDSIRHDTKITQLRQRPKSAYGRPLTASSHQYTDATNERTVVCQNDHQDGPKFCEKTSQLRQRPNSAYGKRTSQVSLQSAGVTNEEMVVQGNNSKDSPNTRTKTPRSRQRIKSYLERWKEAQFESRPCTALGLMELERKQRDFTVSKETKSRNEAPMQVTSDKTRLNNGSADAKDPAELLRKMKSLKQALESANLNHQRVPKSPSAEVLVFRPNTPSTIKGQRERLENLIRNSKIGISKRSQTSLGSLTPSTDQLVNSSSNNKTTRDHNVVSRKSVSFETRPITPWVIARGRDRPGTPGNMLSVEDRPRTPGIRFTGNIHVPSAINDTVDNIPDVMDAHQKQNKDSIEIVQSVHSDYGQSPSDMQISKRTFSNSTPARRIIAARGRYTNTDSDAKAGLDQGNVPMLRSSEDEWSGKRNDPINGYSKLYSTTRNISSNDYGHTLIPKSESVPVQISARSITDQLDSNVLKGRLIVDKLKERYYQTTTLATPTLSQEIRCQSTPITLTRGKSNDLEGAKEELVNKEDNILSWLEDCEESNLSTHLPIISSTEKPSK